MLLLNVIKVFLLQAFFISYVYARYPFISSQFIRYKGSIATYYKNVPHLCGSFTWIPLLPPKNNCDKTSNPFRSYPSRNSTNNSVKKLHDVSVICARDKLCNDLEPEVNLDTVWEQITRETTTPNVCDEMFNMGDYFNASCIFSSRYDIRYYFSQLDKLQQTLADGELCIDRYGRKYPPPVGLGGKCVMFQYEKNGNETAEVFMPIERQDLIERISAFDYTHEIWKNAATLERLLPKNYTEIRNIANCMTLNINKQSFIHCIYDPKDSHMFYPANESYYFCPKNYDVKQSFIQNEAKKELLNFDNVPLYIFYNISNESFVFSEHCYISTGFTPNGTADGKTNITYHVELLGSEACSSVTETQQNGTYYQERIIASIEDYCPWENDTTYSVSLVFVFHSNFSDKQ
uniref:Uncharacterized protein n=1 Tax=Panagrolaimus davidi TaxID=227884 RepID=A0A914PZS4_9BILA